jgi:endonuclease/exonuclease/phosphatase family metal-dependent hydrolase
VVVVSSQVVAKPSACFEHSCRALRAARCALVLAAALGGACAPEVGPASEWTPAEDIQGALAVESGHASDMGSRRGGRIAGEPLRVVTFNVAKSADMSGLAQVFRTHRELLRADVLYLQEIEAEGEGAASRAGQLAQALGMAWVYAPARTHARGTHGIAILSRLPLEGIQVMRLPEVSLPISDPPRIALAATVQVDGVGVRLINVHLDTRLNVPERVLQVRPAVLDAPDPVVFGGDLNTNPFVWAEGALPSLPAESVAAPDHQARAIDDYLQAIGYATPTAALGPTQKVAGVASRLDGLALRGRLSAGKRAVQRDVDLSDHWPLWLDVNVAGASTP